MDFYFVYFHGYFLTRVESQQHDFDVMKFSDTYYYDWNIFNSFGAN